jgi:hypothetical protein
VNKTAAAMPLNKQEDSMNILKQIFAVTAIVAVFSLIACGGDDGNGNDDPKNQSQTISLFGGSSTATVKGVNFTNAEWNGVADKIKECLDFMFDEDVDNQDIYKEIFSRGVTYIVEKEPVGYNNIKTIGDGRTIYIALSKVDDSTHVIDGVISIYTNGTYNG